MNAQALANPSNSPMEIHAIKFSIFWPSTSLANGGAIACSLRLGDIAITNGYVPLWNFARCVDLAAESYGGIFTQLASEFLWKLDRPFTIPPGGVLTPKFLHLGTIADSITARIGYAARILDGQKMPNKLCAPYVASWTSKAINANASDTDSSRETDLVNSTEHPLYVHRFTGRVGIKALVGASTIINTDDYITFQDIQHNNLTISMADSRGYPTIRTNTIFGAAFNRQTRSWECPHILPVGAYYLANIGYTAPPTAYANYSNFQAFVSMIGWREVVL